MAKRGPADIQPFIFSLDGGGRELVTDLLVDRNVKLMVEVGTFLGGSARQWLEAKSDLTVIGVDPWDDDYARILERQAKASYADSVFKYIDDREAVIQSVREHGGLDSCKANLAEFGKRFVPFQGYSPAALYELKDKGVDPDLVYIDSTKHGDDLEVAHSLWPAAILCGDDWTWGADQGYPMRVAVEEFCRRHGYRVTAERATWVIDSTKVGREGATRRRDY